MSIFSKKKDDDKGEVVKNTAKVDNAKKDKKKEVKTEDNAMKSLYSEEKKKAASTGKDGVKIEKKFGSAYKTLVQPMVTEKASMQGAENKYFFEVNRKANKIEIAKAVTEVYGVKPVSVNIINMKGKKVRRGKVTGKKSDWKKAVITLSKGESIKIYEGV